MSKKDDALKLALEALNRNDYLGWQTNIHVREAIREALAEQPAQQHDYWQEEARRYAQNADFWRGKYESATAQQEPVAWATQMGEYAHIRWSAKRPEYPMVYEVPLYTSPPAQRKPLTNEEIVKITADPCLYIRGGDYRIDIARAIEAAHGITGEQK